NRAIDKGSHAVAEAGAIVNRSIWREVPRERILFVLLVLALMAALAVLCLGLFKPILDQYLSRQTQTALTSYWLMQGGPIFAYETPVVGFPWSIPYEFPVYQIIAAILSAAGIPLD